MSHIEEKLSSLGELLPEAKKPVANYLGCKRSGNNSPRLAVKKDVLVDYKVLTKWSSSPDDWNIMVIEIFPNMASYDTFWEDWAAIDAETVDTPEFQERLGRLQSTADTQFLGTVFAREVRLKPQ